MLVSGQVGTGARSPDPKDLFACEEQRASGAIVPLVGDGTVMSGDTQGQVTASEAGRSGSFSVTESLSWSLSVVGGEGQHTSKWVTTWDVVGIFTKGAASL